MSELTGQQLGHYIIGPILGRGGMGEVYKAFPLDGSAPVALKVLREHYQDDFQIQQRFLREVRLMESISHEHIVPVLGIDEQDGLIYFVMQLINGPTLGRVLDRKPLNLRQSWVLLLQAGRALDHLHKHNIIHRDIKPDNLFLERKSEGGWHLYLGDFGLGKAPGQDTTLTKAGVSIGTLEYMAPEAIGGERLDHLADVYSLGVTAYEMLLGCLPLDPQYEHLQLIAQVMMPPRQPRQVNPKFPPSLEGPLMRAIAHDKQARHNSVHEFLSALHDALEHLNDEERATVYWPE